ncbi:MAG TPA: PilZ domain-containing protein [Candidatus Aquilonibacter sp.]|nr:PilZ domain-containing protein [Candidatus Aquilonibacter sp.]
MVQPKHPRARRYPFVAAVELTAVESTGQLKEKTTDLSLYGCHVATKTPWAAGTKVRIRISHMGASFAALATVAHTQPGIGMGIAFTRIGPNEQALLDSWIAALRDH